MKLVLDTNIFISAFFWGGNPRKILNRVIAGIDDLFITQEIVEEIVSVMSRPKFNADKKHIESFINAIKEISNHVVIEGKIKNICRDSEDDKIVECGWVAKVDYIVTGDDDLLTLKAFENIRIITASEYLHTLQ